MEGRAAIQTERRRKLENEVSHFFVITKCILMLIFMLVLHHLVITLY